MPRFTIIRHLIPRRPSPAMAVALVALTAALTSTAAALPATPTTHPHDTLNRHVATQHINNVNQANTTAAFAGTLLAATVDAGCAVTTNTGGIVATQTGSQCDVAFPRSVATCTVLVSPFAHSGPGGGEAVYGKLGGALVRVGRFNSAGGGSTPGLFSILAVC